MQRLTALVIAAALCATPALAQEVPETAKKDLWCGLAFGIIVGEIPDDVSDADRQMAQQFIDGSVMLIGRATAAYLEAGYEPAAFEKLMAEQQAHVAENMSGPEAEFEYDYEECRVLIGL